VLTKCSIQYTRNITIECQIERLGGCGKPIERCLISSFQVVESLGVKGDLRQWEHLLRIGD
jgi:hypothetical protein